ncbi:transposase [Salinibacter ruber]|uniref:transposase n=1 Tax=Salinibacter ruber TaxID=146919 RepID=UPI003C6E9B6F
MNLSVLRGGFSTKIHLVTDGNGLPMGALLTAGQRHEAPFFTEVMDAVRVPRTVGRPRKRPEAIAGDRAYDSKENRQWCWQKNIESVIPARNGMHTGPGRPPTCDEKKYEQRNVVERLVGRLKERRRVATLQGEEGKPLQGDAPMGLCRRISEAIILRQSLVLLPGFSLID